jgi:DNA-binding NarL/FixJ family response regulator
LAAEGDAVLTVLACVRTPDAARAIAVCADRLGVSASVRTAVTAVEAIARLAERSADLVFVDGPLTRPDPVGFVRRALAYAPRATLVVYGLPEPSVASALIAAGARGVIRGGDTDLVTAVTKTVLLLGLTDTVALGPVMAASGALAPRASVASTTVASGPVSTGRRPSVSAAPSSASGDPSRGTRPLVTGKVNGSANAASAADTRNGGPGYSTPQGPRIMGMDSLESERGVAALAGAATNGHRTPEVDSRGGLPASLVPQQRMDLPRGAGTRTPSLTERELQVLRGMADGKSNAEIGRELFVSEDTVKTHARRLFRKLGARDRAHAVASGFRLGLVG